MNIRRCSSFLILLITLLLCNSVAAISPPVESGYAIQTVANAGRYSPQLDFDLDRFERGHIALIESTGTALSSSACFLRYVRFDGVVWRNNAVNEFSCDPAVVNNQRGFVAAVLSDRTASLPIFNVLHVEINATLPSLSRIMLARMRGNAVLSTETIAVEAVDRGIQLEAAPDGVLHALWRTPSGAIRHAIRSTLGTWSINSLGILGSASAPATAMSADGRLLVGFVSGGQIGIWQYQNNAYVSFPAIPVQSIRPPIALHFRGGSVSEEVGVAAVRQDDGDQLYYLRGSLQGFAPPQFPALSGLGGAFRLLDRHALPNQLDPQASAWLAFENAGQTQLASFPASLANSLLVTQAQFGGLVQGLALSGNRQFAPAFDLNGSGELQWHQNEHWSIKDQALITGSFNVLAQAMDRDGSPLVLVRGASAMQLGSWSESTNQFQFEELPTALMPPVSQASMAYQFDAASALLSVAFQHPGSQTLHVIGRTNIGGWRLDYAGEVDAPGSGSQAQIAIDDRFERFVVHLNSSNFRPLLLTRFGGPLNASISTVLSASTAEDLQSKPRIALVPETGDLYVSFQPRTGELRLLHRRPNGSLTSDAIEHSGEIVGEHHDVAASALGEPGLIYSVRSGAQTRLFYRYVDDTRVFTELMRPAAEVGNLLGISLDLKNQSARLARVLRYQNGGLQPDHQLIFDQRRVGFSPSVLPWRAQRFSNFAPLSDRVLVNAELADRLMFFDGSTSSRLVLAQRMHQMDDEGTEIFSPIPPIQRFGSSFSCPCLNPAFSGVPISVCTIFNGGNVSKTHIDTTDLFRRLRDKFGTTAAGRYYLSLFAQHGNEIIALTLRNPRALGNRIRALMEFRPGLEALVAGTGAQERMSPAMLLQARSVWLDWRNNGTPALRATMQNELTRLNNLTVFDNMTFEQWFESLSVGTAGDRVFANGFE